MQYDDSEQFDEDEDMPATERDLADDAQWKLIQKNTFSRWANEHLKTVNKSLGDLESDLSDGLRLLALIEVLSGKKFKHINKRPNFRTQKLENVTMSLRFLEEDEGIRIVNIDSSDIVDKKLKLILGLIWTLILHYSISMPMWEGEEPTPSEGGPTPKQRLLNWVQSKVPDLPIKNFTTDWNDGKAIGALVDACGPGLCPDWDTWDPKKAKDNAKEAMDAAEQWLDVPQLIKPKELTNPKVDEMSMMTYLSQFPKSKLKPGAPTRPRVNPNRVRAFGPGVEPKGNQVGAPARFTIDTYSAGKGDVVVIVLNPKGKQETCEVVFNNDKNLTYSCCYTPTMEGQYRVIVKFNTKEIPKSPYTVNVEGQAGDPTKVTAKGPGLEKSGVICSKKTFFEVYTQGAGNGKVDVVILDPHGRKDTVKPSIQAVPGKQGVFLVEYIAMVSGLHSINVFFSGNQIPKSPFGVNVSPPSNAKICYASGRGIQPRGIRVRDQADFKVHTTGAGEATVKVQVIGPGGIDVPCKVVMSTTEEGVYNCVYSPTKPGNYVINVTFGDVHITKSPFKVEVGPFIESKIRAYGPGLEAGVVGQPAVFTVETNGEVGALGFSIEGPSQAKIDCKDNGDGSADVTYWPTTAGEYAVHILCNEQDIPKSPYMAQIIPSGEFDASKVIAKGPGLQKTGVTTGKKAEFTVDTRSAGRTPQPLKISCLDVDLKPVEVQITDNKNGTYNCSYMPKRNVKHTIMITYGSVNIPNSPYRVYVSEPSTPSNVKVFGPGVEKGVKTGKLTYFKVDCSKAGPGDVAIALTDANGRDVPVKTTDNGDGTFTVEYEPKSPGQYTVQVYFAEKPIPQSPIKVNVESSIDVSKVKVVGLEPKMPIGVTSEIGIISAGLPKANATVTVTSPTGKTRDMPVTETIDGHAAKVSFNEPGPHKVDVTYGGAPVPKSPFKVEAFRPPKVIAYGPGLKGGEALKPATFTIDTREAKTPGGIGVTVEGPGESKIECKDNGDGTCGVAYLPPQEGTYKVNVTYGNQHIPMSPFTAQIGPSTGPPPGPAVKKPDLKGVTAYGPGLSPDGVFIESPTEFTVDAKSVSPVGQGKVRAILTNPSGTLNDTAVRNNGDGTYNVQYTPFEEGPVSLDVTYDEAPIPQSPFKVQAVPGNDPNRVKAYGPGLEGGVTNLPAEFTVDMRGAGKGGLGLAIEGPVEAQMNCQDNRDGTCNVQYQPTKAGDYDIAVKFADKDIPGSPFRVSVCDPVDASKVKCYGPGIDTKGVRAGEPATFTIDAKDAGKAPVDVTYTDQNGKPQKAKIVPVEEGVFNATYVPADEGKCKVDVKYGGQNVPNSPFNMNVLPGVDASKVKVTGAGVSNAVPASLPVTFDIDTREAGVADLEAYVQRPDGTYIRPMVLENDDGTFSVTYTPEDLGVYNIKVKYGGQEVPHSPFNVKAIPTGDATKCRITEGAEKCVPVNKETVITVDAAQAGTGKVTCRIRSPSGSDIDIDIIDNSDGTFSICFTPQFAGDYTISIKFGGQEIPQGDYTIQVGTAEDLIVPDTVDNVSAAPGSGLYQPVDFCIPVGPIFNFVSAYVVMPSGKRAYPKIEDNQDGTVTIKYQPSETGLHEMHVNYNNQSIEGSPFLFHVDAVNSGYVTAYGPGLSHGVTSEPAIFTINTKNAGAGGMSLAIEGPSKTEINCKDNEDGTCTVSYVPTAPGEYCITVKFADKHITGSPFKSKITQKAGEPKRRAQISVGSSSEVSLKVTESDIASLTASIRSPSGREEPCILKRLANGHLGITFTPRETGEHLVNVFRNGKHIANSPFKIIVGESEIGNASKVKVSGKGLTEGMANEVNEFIVDTRDAGYGGMSLSIEGPSKADIECHDNEDGTCRVTYKPTEPGTYIINIKFADQHVPGSPYSVKIGGEPSSRITERITRHKEAVDVTHIGSQCELSLKIPGTSPFDMTASVTSPSGVTELCDVMSKDDQHYNIKFVPKEMGVHTVSVKHKDMHIPGSPFEFTVGPIAGGGSHKVRAGGPGLERGEINQPCDFNIYTREAGAGGLSIAVEGPSKAEIDFQDRKDGSCGVTYKVTEPGEYLVSIKFNDEHIPDSPFRVEISPSIGDARKLSVAALQDKGLIVGKPAAFIVNYNGAKRGGKLTARVVAPSGSEDDAIIQEIDDGEYAVRFIPHENGPHLVHVMFDGYHIPESPFRILVGKVDADPGRVTAHGEGLKTGKTGQVSKFFVNTVNAGAGALAVTVEGPSKVRLECKETEEGYEFTYTPNAPGDYLITIRYAGVHIAGSPFKAKVEVTQVMRRVQEDGSQRDIPIFDENTNSFVNGRPIVQGEGQVSSVQEHASVVVETVTKTSTMTKFSGIQRFSSDASKVSAQGKGLNKAFRGQKSTFTVDTSGAGNNILYVGMMGPKGPCEELIVAHKGNNQYTINYMVKERGTYMLMVKWGDEQIPGSPFCVKCD
ncbi:filamin-A-like isoform X3 [Haliotis rufescens]|uniref:filamin-A-like isoform X3 n=1 Tax=Haliotis rufescens TaxID=6454 RepID=UPI00201EF0E8|nr:filamin-A-like isoform X3 [Haliotis rufescens]